MRARLFLLPILLLTGTLSCVSQKKSLREHKGSYLESVKLNYEAGEKALLDSDYDKAISYFQFVRSKYPGSQYAALSDLRMADAKYGQKKWLDAASLYEVFIRLHPRHEEIPYASYRLGISYFHAIPSDFFLLPPSETRDQSFTKEAVAALDRFILLFPDSQFITDAKEKRAELFSKLAKYNQEIAKYYGKRGKYEACVARYLKVDELYPEAEESAESLYLAAEIIRSKLHNPDGAIQIYERLINEKKSGPFVEKAREQIGILTKTDDIKGQD
jgi:outer membrane protein assembly factor BamD